MPFYRDADEPIFVFDPPFRWISRRRRWLEFSLTLSDRTRLPFPFAVVGCKADDVHPDAEKTVRQWRKDGVAAISVRSLEGKPRVRFAPYFEVCPNDVTHKTYGNLDALFKKVISITAKRALRGLKSSSVLSACLGRSDSGSADGGCTCL